MRLLPFTPAASQCAMSDLGMHLSPALDLDVEPHVVGVPIIDDLRILLPPAAGFAVAVRRSPRGAVRPWATHATRDQGTGAPLLLASRSWGWLSMCWILLPVGASLQ